MPTRSNAEAVVSGRPSSPGFRQCRLELFETTLRDVREQLVTVAKMPVGSSRADAGDARGVGKGETGRAFLGDQIKGCLQQRLFQIAMVITAFGATSNSLRQLMLKAFT